MRVLLLHPEDRLSSAQFQGWDLIVDLARAPLATYEAWSETARCRVVSLAHYSQGFEDLHRLRPAVEYARGMVVDRFGIDWWGVMMPMFYKDLEQCFMLLALARELGNSIQLYSSRTDARAAALGKFLGVECLSLNGASSGLTQKFRHYRKAFSHLDWDQLSQIAQDKLDPEHSIRRRFRRRKIGKGKPVFLLPTAYINISRTAVSYATLLPEEQFLLVVARSGGKLTSVPANVQVLSLDPYFGRTDGAEFAALTEQWRKLEIQLVDMAPEFRLAGALGILPRGIEMMHWGLAARDAWVRLYDSETISGCLSADDVNPYTNLPLFVAAHRGIPALAVHHGALDGRMAIKPLGADFYLAKGELEQDYLLRSCRIDPGRIVMGGPPQAVSSSTRVEEKSWLVFFTEPYANLGWRTEHIYEEILPPLCALALQCKLKLIFKLHPFESVKGHKKLVRKFLSAQQLKEMQWIAGPPTPELWSKTQFAITGESTVALECVTREIPIFLCGWLQNVYGSYLQQYAKFGVGHILNAPDQMRNVPQLLASWKNPVWPSSNRIWQTIQPAELRSLLNGTYKRGPEVPTQVGISSASQF